MKKTPNDRGARFSIAFVAFELGVDRKTLSRRCDEAAVDTSNGVTFREAFEALTRGAETEFARRRRTIAEAQSAEIVAKERAEKFEPKIVRKMIVANLKTKLREGIENFRKISAPQRRELVSLLSEITVDE